MFTGIISQIGTIKRIDTAGDLKTISIQLAPNVEKMVQGDSIAVNGVCLTLTQIKETIAAFDVIKETLAKSNLLFLKENDKVNVEFSLKSTDRISGHFVTGHIDCLGKIKTKRRENKAAYFEIAVPEEFNKYIVPKGSIAVNGISLTVLDSFNSYFSFYSIPHTLDNTTLKYLKAGYFVNVEFDILAKYTDKTRLLKPASKISIEYLKEKGYF